jgi:hypothetical protein
MRLEYDRRQIDEALISGYKAIAADRRMATDFTDYDGFDGMAERVREEIDSGDEA